MRKSPETNPSDIVPPLKLSFLKPLKKNYQLGASVQISTLGTILIKLLKIYYYFTAMFLLHSIINVCNYIYSLENN